ncbi:MAG: guanylate kinase [Candidatus Koribacter versatilis]|uniref:Guanylate kinase n=1 Tax=Candidatus Korobacter versatilis TaxID=658062 RepID=A0A932A9K4_9BACT|nr:guanylate kinase [Candidatus Koribacter versatilis]
MSGILYIISAPSGSGKSTLVTEIRKVVPELEFSVSYTTRPRRGSEQNGREYYFISREEFERMIASDDFLEHADVFGNYYGTAQRFLHEAAKRGKDLLLDIDVQGEKQVKVKVPEAASIFVLPPSRQVLELRLRRRSEAEGADSEGVIQRRLHEASKEIENYPNYDYILVNDQLELSIDQLKAIVLGERLKRAGRALTPDEQAIVERSRANLRENMREKAESVLKTFQLSAAPQR